MADAQALHYFYRLHTRRRPDGTAIEEKRILRSIGENDRLEFQRELNRRQIPVSRDPDIIKAITERYGLTAEPVPEWFYD